MVPFEYSSAMFPDLAEVKYKIKELQIQTVRGVIRITTYQLPLALNSQKSRCCYCWFQPVFHMDYPAEIDNEIIHPYCHLSN